RSDPPPRSTLLPYTPLFRSRFPRLAQAVCEHRRHRNRTKSHLGLRQTRSSGRREDAGCVEAGGTIAISAQTKRWPLISLKDPRRDRKSTRLNSSHQIISYAV